MSNGKTVAIYGKQQDLELMAKRIRELLPGGNKLTPPQALTLAQVSIVHGLDPFNGEVWFIPNVGLMIGIKGLRKKGHEQMAANGGGNFWTTFRELVDADERKRFFIPDGSLAFECRLFDSETVLTFTDTIKALREAEIPVTDALAIVGKQPYTSGIGVFKVGESTRMLPVECAMKRAEAAAIKRRFDVPFEIDVERDAAETYTEADYQPGAQPEGVTTTTINAATVQKDISDLFGGNPAPQSVVIDHATGEVVELETKQAELVSVAPRVTNANELLSVANSMTDNHYRNVFQVKNSIDPKMKSWPAPDDTETWQFFLSILVDRVAAEEAA